MTTAATAPRVGVGHGSAPAHHGELLQGVFADGAEVRPALLTLPLRHVGSRATFTPTAADRSGRVTVYPPDKTRARAAAEQLLQHLHTVHDAPPVSGALRLRSGVPVGLGLGSSSADVLAAMRAVIDALGLSASDRTLCQIAATVEGACDPLPHLPRTVLFAQRHGHVIEDFGTPLPPLVLLSCETGNGRPVETERCVIPDRGHLPDYERLRARVRRALASADAAALGAVATESAELNQERLPKAELRHLREASRRHGGVGVQVAHSGNVAGVLFCARSGDTADRLRRTAAWLESSGVRVRGWYDVPTGR